MTTPPFMLGDTVEVLGRSPEEETTEGQIVRGFRVCTGELHYVVRSAGSGDHSHHRWEGVYRPEHLRAVVRPHTRGCAPVQRLKCLLADFAKSAEAGVLSTDNLAYGGVLIIDPLGVEYKVGIKVTFDPV